MEMVAEGKERYRRGEEEGKGKERDTKRGIEKNKVYIS